MSKNNSVRLLRRMAGLMAAVLILLSAGPAATAQSSGSRTLRVAFPELEGISEMDQYDRHRGVLVDYLNEISKYTNWEYEYIAADNDNLISDFLDGKYDLMGGTFYSPGFEEYFAYPEYSTGRSRGVLLCRRDDDSLTGHDLTALNGKTIGVYEKAANKIQYLEEFLASKDLDCELKYYTIDDGEDNLYQKLREGEVDMLMGNDQEIGGEFYMVTDFPAQPYYIVTTLANTEVLDGLNMALKYIAESTPTFSDDVSNEHFPNAKLVDINLNKDELRYISENGTLTVAVAKGMHPIYCVDSSVDSHEGMLPGLLLRISEFTGLQFTYIYADTYEESIRMVQDGRADVLGCFLSGNEEAFSDGLALSCSYISLNDIVLKNKAVSYPGDDLICGILAGGRLPARYAAAEIRSYDTVKALVSAVDKGEVDYVYGVSALLEREIQNHRYLNVQPVTQASDNTEAAIAIARPITPELLTIFNKAINSIPLEERVELLNGNLVALGNGTLSFSELINAYPVTAILILGGVLLLISAVVLITIKSRMKNVLMQSLLEAAEVKSKAKSEFLSQMSHELRTPMNAIVGLTDLACMEREISPELEEKLKKISGSSQYLLSLINDILDMSRIENGKMEIERINFSLPQMLDELGGMMEAQAERKGLRFEVVCQTSHSWLVGDPVRLRQILTNLLSNAVKFTDAGGEVSLRAEELDCSDGVSEFRFSVSDTGVGIREEDQERIFEAFEQINPAVSKSMGTGLGLAISRRMAQIMGGDIQVKSELGCGSEFWMTLSFPQGTEQAAAQEEPGRERSLEGMRVMLAEDNDLNAEIARELLSTQKVETCRAINGQEAVDQFLASEPGEIQAIIMDIRMPVKDGYEATREIRASGRPDADVPIIALTANSFKEDETQAMEAGMNGFVSKPVEPNRLFSVLRRFL